MKVAGAALLCATMVALAPSVASAQVFAQYYCGDGTQFAAGFYEGSVALQLDGQSLLLPRRAALPGNVRYAKSGVSLTISKKQEQTATLRRAGTRSECSSTSVFPFFRTIPGLPDEEH